ncbi:MAG: lytic transglycosylase domain-containing protein [Armatimonadota bacterium]|jgi:hypothetical protein
MTRVVLICLAVVLIAPVAAAYDDFSADYLAARERLVPAPVSSRIALRQVLGTGDFAHVELVGDVSGKASAAPALSGELLRTLMVTLDDGCNVELRAGDEIDRLQVGHRIAVIAEVSRGGSSSGSLTVETWIHEWDLPREVEDVEEAEDARAPETPARTPEQPAAPGPAGSGPLQLPRPAASNIYQLDAIETWTSWVLEHNSKLTGEQARDIVRWVLHYAQEYNVNHTLIFALIKWESWFNPACVSHAGAIGLMQLMPGTARGLGVNPHNVQQNIQGGTRYLAEQLGKYADRSNYERVILALACYNAGPNAVKRAGHRVPNIRETQNYVKKVSTTFYELHQAGMP